MPSAIAPITNRFTRRVVRDIAGSIVVGTGLAYYWWLGIHMPAIQSWKAYDKQVFAESKAIHDEWAKSYKK
ncbi:hypothetical protein HDU82_004607 [Entophlyctis luteolus]|nr:hypothetical protein HDU82_004607 [Entophlyctis luteolus]KAJ3388071.1 hypothetical protein HDU84_000314 [Entophlyctis sp. JEL0112]